MHACCGVDLSIGAPQVAPLVSPPSLLPIRRLEADNSTHLGSHRNPEAIDRHGANHRDLENSDPIPGDREHELLSRYLLSVDNYASTSRYD